MSPQQRKHTLTPLILHAIVLSTGDTRRYRGLHCWRAFRGFRLKPSSSLAQHDQRTYLPATPPRHGRKQTVHKSQNCALLPLDWPDVRERWYMLCANTEKKETVDLSIRKKAISTRHQRAGT